MIVAILAGASICLLLVALTSFVQVLWFRTGPICRLTLHMRRRLREAHACGDAAFAISREWRDLSQISPRLVVAALVCEDWFFAYHHGFSWLAIRNAVVSLLKNRKVVGGGSSITNQVARNMFLTLRRHWWRKGLEAWYTILIECFWGKRRIMEVYLNIIEMGPGIFGAEAASRFYFGKPASDLSVEEAARIAVAWPNPIRINPLDLSTCARVRRFRLIHVKWIFEHPDVIGAEAWNRLGISGVFDGMGENKGEDTLTSEIFCLRLRRILQEVRTVYVRGGIGQALTHENKKNFLSKYEYNRQSKVAEWIRTADEGTFAFDCSGLIKAVLWDWDPCLRCWPVDARRGSGRIPDICANEMILRCEGVSDDLQNVRPGELLWDDDHVGICVDAGLAIEATSRWTHCVQMTSINTDHPAYPRRDWKKRGRLPWVDYGEVS